MAKPDQEALDERAEAIRHAREDGSIRAWTEYAKIVTRHRLEGRMGPFEFQLCFTHFRRRFTS